MTNKSTRQQAGISRKEFIRGGAVGMLALMAGTRSVLSATNKAIKVGFLMPNYEQTRWKNADQPFFELEAKKLGMLTYVDASQNSETVQTAQVENMLTEGIDVLVLCPVNGTASTALVRKCSQAGVPVVDYNFLAMGSDVAAFIGRDAVQMAESIAQVAVTQHPKGNYILILGDQSTSYAIDDHTGYRNVLKPYIDKGDITIVSEQWTKEWSPALARAQVENALTKVSNDVVAILSANDDMAFAAIEVLQSQNLAGKVFINGVDASPRAQELIQQGLMTLSNFTDFADSGVQAARAAHTIGTGGKIDTGSIINNGFKDVPWIKVANFNVTKENLAASADKYPWWFDKTKLHL